MSDSQAGGRVIQLVRRSFRRWVDAQDVPATLVATSPRQWVAATFGAGLVVAMAVLLPAAHQFTHLDAKAALLSFIPALALATLFNLTRPSQTSLSSFNWLTIIVGVGALQFWTASLITWSSGPGASLFSCIFLFTAGFHGHLHRVTLKEPFLAVATLVASVVAAVLHPDMEHVAIFSVVVPAALSVELLAGTISSKGAHAHAEAERLRAAVDAQILDQQEREVRRLSQTLVELLGANHDINNSVMSAHLAVDELAALCERPALPPPSEVREVVTELMDSLVHVRSLVARVRKAGIEQPVADTEAVEIAPVLLAVVGNVGARFRETRLAADPIDPAALRAGMRGGALSLRRVLHNLVLNACEGNGQQRASTVRISVQRDSSGGAVAIAVTDDGPGFSPQLLARPIEGFATSKRDGTGLGLYTTERLVRASGGTLERANEAQGGARVLVTLPLG